MADKYEYYCNNCQKTVDPNLMYCPYCGARLHPELDKVSKSSEYKLGNIFDHYFGALIIYWSLWIAPIAFFTVAILRNNGINLILGLPLLIMAYISGKPLYQSVKYRHDKLPGVVFKVVGFLRYLMLIWVFGWSFAGLANILLMLLHIV